MQSRRRRRRLCRDSEIIQKNHHSILNNSFYCNNQYAWASATTPSFQPFIYNTQKTHLSYIRSVCTLPSPPVHHANLWPLPKPFQHRPQFPALKKNKLQAHKTDEQLQNYTLPTPNKSYLLAVFCFKTSKRQDLLHTAQWSKRENTTRSERKTQEKKTRDCIASAQEREAEKRERDLKEDHEEKKYGKRRDEIQTETWPLYSLTS